MMSIDAVRRAGEKAEAEYQALQAALVAKLELDVGTYWGGRPPFPLSAVEVEE